MRYIITIILVLSFHSAVAQTSEVMIYPPTTTVSSDSVRTDTHTGTSYYSGQYLKISLTCGRGDAVSEENIRIAAGKSGGTVTITTIDPNAEDCSKKKVVQKYSRLSISGGVLKAGVLSGRFVTIPWQGSPAKKSMLRGILLDSSPEWVYVRLDDLNAQFRTLAKGKTLDLGKIK